MAFTGLKPLFHPFMFDTNLVLYAPENGEIASSLTLLAMTVRLVVIANNRRECGNLKATDGRIYTAAEPPRRLLALAWLELNLSGPFA